MEVIEDTSNAGKLIEIMCAQANTQELITLSEREVITFIAKNHGIMELAERMACNFQASKLLRSKFEDDREQIINDSIDYYLEHFEADNFFSNQYNEFIVK